MSGTDDAATVTLVSEDGQRLSLDKKSALQMGVFRGLLEGGRSEAHILPVPVVKSTILIKVIEFLQQHRNDPVRGGSRRREGVREGIDEDEDDMLDESCDDEDKSPEDADAHAHEDTDTDVDIEDDEDSEDDEYIEEDTAAVMSPWDQKFLDSLDLPTIIELTKAANYLNIPLLLDLACRMIAKEMTGLSAKELRIKFGLPSDYTPEEEAKMAAEMAWLDD